MPLQKLYEKLQAIAFKHPMLTMEDGSEVSDPCHADGDIEPPICLSPQDLEDPLAKEITYTTNKGEKKLGPMEILEMYRQLVRLDNADGKLDGHILKGSLIFSSKPLSSTRFIGHHWTPPQRLQTFLKFYEGKLSEVLPPVNPLFELSRSSVEQLAKGMMKNSFPLAEPEVDFIEKIAGRLKKQGHQQAGDLVSSLTHKTRVFAYQPNKEAPDPESGATMLFRNYYRPSEGEKVEASVFLSTILPPNKKRYFFYSYNGDQSAPLRGATPRNRSLQRLNLFVSGGALNPPDLLASHIPTILRDTYIYRYLAYHTAKGPLTISPEAYKQYVVLHEAYHGGVLEKAPTIALDENSDSFDWDVYGQRLLQTVPQPTKTEPLLNFLASALMIQRGTLEVSKRYKQRLDLEVALITEEDIQNQRRVTQLLSLADEATEYLIDEASWRMILAPKELIENSLGGNRKRILNINEDKIP